MADEMVIGPVAGRTDLHALVHALVLRRVRALS